ncbi:hypothetical protein [Variovorax sp. 278MFTsu5.1]|jgi:hypothetical protein|uniref:hypothetical protein n=1 Tax=Variovorax sp. 278MFTsu5.1 TaxID=3158366 RepID=UPI003AAFAB83
MRASKITHHQKGSLTLALTCVVVVMVLISVVLSQALVLRGARHDLSKANARADQAVQALGIERQQRDLANRSVLNLQNQLDAQRENADATLAALSGALRDLPDVRLPRRVGGVLRNVVKPEPAAGAATTSSRAGEAASQADATARGGATDEDGSVSCKAVAVWAAENIELVLKPNALQLEAIQRFYEEQRVLLLLNGREAPR